MLDKSGELGPYSSKVRLYSRLSSPSGAAADTGLSKLIAPTQPERRPEHQEVREAFEDYRKVGVAGETAKRICLSLDTAKLGEAQKKVQEGMLAKLGRSLSARKKSGDTAPRPNLEGLSDYSVEFTLRVNPVDALMFFLEEHSHLSAFRDIHTVIAKSLEMEKDKFKAERPQQYEIIATFRELIDLDVKILLGKQEDKQAAADELYSVASQLYKQLQDFKRSLPVRSNVIR